MLTYHYCCMKCNYQYVMQKRISEPSPSTCPQCGTDSLQPVLYAVPVIDTTPRTLGGQADRNHQKAGAYEREHRHREIELARQRAKAENLPEGMESARNPDPQGTWWRPGQKEVNPALVRADPKKKLRYLEKGDI